jgi:hypothetical protein
MSLISPAAGTCRRRTPRGRRGPPPRVRPSREGKKSERLDLEKPNSRNSHNGEHLVELIPVTLLTGFLQ